MNKVRYGLKNLHVAFRDVEASEPAWETPIAIPGVVGFRPSLEGDEQKFYADNVLYFTSTKNDGYKAELEVALLPDAIVAEMLGWDIDANGALVEIADAVPKKFALLGQVEGDSRGRRFVYYDCQAARPAKEEKTSEANIEPQTETLSVTVFPIEIEGRMLVKTVMEATEENSGEEGAYTKFFESVYIPELLV